MVKYPNVAMLCLYSVKSHGKDRQRTREKIVYHRTDSCGDNMRLSGLCVGILVGGAMLSGCYTPGAGQPRPRPRPMLGKYRQPVNLRPEPTRRIPDKDECHSRLYMGLVGQHEGGIVFAALPGRVRVIKPAEQEIDRDDFLQDMNPQPPFVEVREYLSGQVLYAPSIKAVTRIDELGPIIRTRLTIELDREGYVNRLTCR